MDQSRQAQCGVAGGLVALGRGKRAPAPPPSSSSSSSNAESLDRLLPPVGAGRSPRKRTTSQCKSEPPLLRTSKRTIYTAGRPPWYNEHGTQSKEAFAIGERGCGAWVGRGRRPPRPPSGRVRQNPPPCPSRCFPDPRRSGPSVQVSPGWRQRRVAGTAGTHL